MTLGEAKVRLAELAVFAGPIEYLPFELVNMLMTARTTGQEVITLSDNGRAYPHDIHVTWNFDDGYAVWPENPVSQISI